MTAANVELSGSVLKVHFQLSNQSSETWASDSGWAIGYQLFDEPTGTLVIDGARAPLNLAPSEGGAFDLQVPVPPEPGVYTICVSPVHEHVAWLHEQGSPFLLIEASVSDAGSPFLAGWRITARSAVRRKRMLRSALRAFTLPAATVWTHRSLVRTLVRRDVLGRYSGSFGGAFWAVLNPLLLMLTYFFVFGIVLNSRFPGDPSRSGFTLYYLAGFLPWLAFSEAIGRAPFTLIEHRGFIKKLVFPVEILPVNLVVSGLVTEFFGIILFAIALLLLRGHVPASALYLPLLLIPQILFTAGICWFLSALGVFVRDLAQINGFIVTIWFFITPICYAESMVPRQGAALMTKNPIYVLVRAYRAIFLESRAPDWTPLAWMSAASLVVFLLGHAWFYKLRKSFADII
ncbi:MAG TPA: ABC transporter permease [Bryobacteraceae bacterium]|nr:ABC transporter permease [Bryobacteraceae bacterium]